MCYKKYILYNFICKYLMFFNLLNIGTTYLMYVYAEYEYSIVYNSGF